MAEMLLLNPAKRRKSRKGSGKRRTAAQRAATARMIAANRRGRNPAKRRSPRRAARRAPVVVMANPRRRRRNPTRAHHHTARRRRRNPISLHGLSGGVGAMLKNALIGGAGAVAVDVAYGYVGPMLPASLQRTPGTVGIGDAVKAGFTVAMGKLLSKATRGLSQRAAVASLTVQAYEIVKTFVPSTMTLGYFSPARIVPGQQRIGPNVNRSPAMGRFSPGTTPLLNRYEPAGGTSMALNAARESTMFREGFFQR